MVLNGKSLLHVSPIKNMLLIKEKAHGVSHGLGEAGYDIRVKQDVIFKPQGWDQTGLPSVATKDPKGSIPQIGWWDYGRFIIASTIEEFDMPDYLVGIVHDKSTWARKGVSVFNTVIEPGWKGFLTLEIVFHGSSEIIIPAGSGIAQVIFHELSDSAVYKGKYQHQADEPVAARSS